MELFRLIREAARRDPGCPAVACGSYRATYAEFAERVSQFAGHLAAAGFAAGDRIAILSENCHAFLETYFAAAGAGLVLVPVNTRLSAREIAYILSDSGAGLLVASGRFREVVAEISPDVPVLFTDSRYEALLRDAEPLAEPVPRAASDLAQIYYTSGTTGRPKGVMLTHGNVLTHARATIEELSLTAGDVWAHVAPLFHLADAWATFAITAVGGRHVLLPSFDAAGTLRAFREEGVTLSNLIPTMLSALVSEKGAADGPYPSLRLMLSGGAPISPALVRRVMGTFGCEYVQTYGLTETSPYLTLSLLHEHLKDLPEEERFRYRSRTGRRFKAVELRVVGPDGEDVAHDDREVGEIRARGPTVTPGYWNLPEETSAAFVDGWLLTGDLAVVDREGYVNIVDRKKDMIVTGGENVYSTEVEHALAEHPAVLLAAVIGIPDERFGESVKAFVERRPEVPAKPADLIEFCRARLAGYKVPRSVEFVDRLPRTGSGKLTKKPLRDKEWEGRDRRVN